MDNRVTVDEAISLLSEHVKPLCSEHVVLDDAYGRMLRQPIICDRDLPPFDRVMMDGIAVIHDSNTTEWEAIDTQYAGDPPTTISNHITCVEIMTGSVLPVGADTIIPIEDYNIKKGKVFLHAGVVVEKGQFVHIQGSVSKRNAELIDSSLPMDGRALAICASVGMTDLTVAKRPKVAFISTGNELVAPCEEPSSSQIRRSNDHMLKAELKKLGIDLQTNLHLPDNRELILQKLIDLTTSHDLIVFSGGVSKGKADYIPTCVWEAGYEVIYHGIRQKPGGPMLAAKHPSGTIILGLPGNPMSSLVCTRLYVRMVLNVMADYPIHKRKIALKESTRAKGPKGKLIPVRLENDDTIGVYGELVFPHTSGDMVSVLNSDGIVFLSNDSNTNETNFVDYFDWTL